MTFSVGDCCIVAGGPCLNEEWYLKLSDIILIGAFHDKYYIFVDGSYFIPAVNNDNIVKHL